MTKSLFFHVRNLEVVNAKKNGVSLEGEDNAGMYYGVFENLIAKHNGGDGLELFGDSGVGVRLGNVGFYNCKALDNDGRGIYNVGASITLSRCTAKGNGGVQLEVAESYSTNVIDSIVTAASGSADAIHCMKDSETTTTGADGWVWGFHFLGGHLTDQIEQAPASSGTNGLNHSLVHTLIQSSPLVTTPLTVDQSTKRRGFAAPYDSPDKMMSPGIVIPAEDEDDFATTTEEGVGSDP